MAKKKVTIENLAAMVKRGFDEVTTKMATKEDLNMLKKDFEEFRKYTVEEFDRINADLHDIKVALGPAMRILASHDAEVRDLRARVARLERRAGLTK